MGKLVLYSICSLDGAVDDPNRLFPPNTDDPAPPEFDDEMEEPFRRLIESQTAVLLGRGMMTSGPASGRRRPTSSRTSSTTSPSTS